MSEIARRYYVRGRVQGVGFRNFVKNTARGLNLRGFTRNLADGRVEVYAVGSEHRLDTLARELGRGPVWADVQGVDQEDAPLQQITGFSIRH